jgi:hypothetical protein
MATAGVCYRFSVGSFIVNSAGCFLCLGVIVTIGAPCGDPPVNLDCTLAREMPGADYRRFVNPNFHAETGYELYYRIQMTPCIALTPDVQYVHQPRGLKNAAAAVVLAMRLRIIF